MNDSSHFALLLSIGLVWTLTLSSSALGQQLADPNYVPVVGEPMHARGSGPIVLIDEGHNNFHTKDGRYAPFASLVDADGYRVGSHEGELSAASLGDAAVIVISNSLNAVNTEEWALPTPSAFTDAEIRALVDFVESGGGPFSDR